LPLPGKRAWRIALASVVGTLLLSEIGLRIAFARLPTWIHDTIQDVRITPLTDWRLSTTALWQPDPEYGAAVQPGLSNTQFRLPDTTITVSTASLLGSRVGIRAN